MWLKGLDFDVDRSTWRAPRVVPQNLDDIRLRTEVDLQEVLLHVGVRTRPPSYSGLHINDFWAWLRYAQAFDTRHQLRIAEAWLDLDPHQKTILSDDLGIGMASAILFPAMNLIAMVDTTFMVRTFPGLFRLGANTAKVGKKKTPDFLAIDQNYKVHVIECKGTQTSAAVLSSQMDAGADQKSNLRRLPPQIRGERLIAGIFVPNFRSNEQAQFVVEDPPLNGKIKLLDETIPEFVSAMIRAEYAQAFRAIGHFELANALITDTPENTRNLIALGDQYLSLDKGRTGLRQVSQVMVPQTGKNVVQAPILAELSMSTKFVRDTIEILQSKDRVDSLFRNTLGTLKYHVSHSIDDPVTIVEFRTGLKCSLRFDMALELNKIAEEK